MKAVADIPYVLAQFEQIVKLHVRSRLQSQTLVAPEATSLRTEPQQSSSENGCRSGDLNRESTRYMKVRRVRSIDGIPNSINGVVMNGRITHVAGFFITGSSCSSVVADILPIADIIVQEFAQFVLPVSLHRIWSHSALLSPPQEDTNHDQDEGDTKRK
ncbi:MAG: hypothetical protein Q9184_002200 [Pyrenodesmia sp. 2 TL-2023]